MPITTKLTVADGSRLTATAFAPFEQKIQKALANAFGKNVDLQCNINIDSKISPSVKDQFDFIGRNIYFGILKGSNIDAAARRAFIFECLAINDPVANTAQRIILIISTVGFVSTPPTPPKYNPENNGQPADESESTVSFDAVVPKFSLDKVILDDSTRSQISRAIALIKNQKLIFDIWGFREVDPNTKTILCFFGAPGTGKTMCAHAIAKALGKKIMIASYASIESKWVGEGPKNMRKIFKDATEQDALLFFDEADSFLSKRVNDASTGSDKHYNRMSNEMFQLLEDYDGIIIFATNLVADFDRAFKSRILSFIEFKLPDASTRTKLIESMIPSKLPMAEPLGPGIIHPLVNCSEGFSGREIRKALLTSLSEGALNEVEKFTVADLLTGFESVMAERKAIEETATRQRGIIQDFIEANAQNQAIVEVCQWALDQKDTVTDGAKAEFFQICKRLNLELPDLTVSYKNKDIKADVERIVECDRVVETLRYVVQLIAAADMSDDQAWKVISDLAAIFNFDRADAVLDYYRSLRNLL